MCRFLCKIINVRKEKWAMAHGRYESPFAVPDAAQSSAFRPLKDLGFVSSRSEWCHATALRECVTDRSHLFHILDRNVVDENFPNPTRVIAPRDKFRVQVFVQVGENPTTSEERMAFLDSMKAVHLGAQGAALVWSLKRNKVPKGYRCASFDRPDRLWMSPVSGPMVPCLETTIGRFSFTLEPYGNGSSKKVWTREDAMIVFTDPSK
jgi:hypothetical protein